MADIYALMKSRTLAYSCVFITLAGLAVFSTAANVADIGQKVDDFKLQDTAGNTHTLHGYAGKIVVLAFWSFKCPTALAIDDRLTALQDKYASQGVVVVAVDSNANESGTEIQRNAANLHLSFPILLDLDGELAVKLAATLTPSIYVLDGGGTLRYKGSLDGKEKSGDKKHEGSADAAIESILAGRAVSFPVTQASGCNIKRRTS